MSNSNSWGAPTCGPRPSLQRHADGLRLRVFAERFQALLPAVTALLVATERGLDGERAAVHRYLPGVDLFGHTQTAREITAPDARDQSVLRVVGERERLCFVGKG